jgi:serine/threonine-protein kinase HipA
VNDRLSTCRDAGPAFLLYQDDAKAVIAHQISVIRERFQSACDEAELATLDRQLLWQRQLPYPFAFYGAPGEVCVEDRLSVSF